MRARVTEVLTVVLAAFLAGCAAPEVRTPPPGQAVLERAWVWDSSEDFDRCYRNRYLDSESEPGSAKLVRSIVITDDMGAGYNDFQPVRGKTQAKKILVLDDPDVTGAILLVGGSVKGCEILVNGCVLYTQPLDRSYWHQEFERYVIPPSLLRAGANEFVFRANESAGSRSIRVERSQQPNRSAVSRDGGHLWDFDHLGEGGYINGELQVRLRVERYAPSAWMASPVLDLTSAVETGGIPAGADGRIEELIIDADVPAGTSVSAFLRTGATPDGYEENWTHWHAWPGERDRIRFQRFAQWRLELRTDVAQRTPVVRSVEARLASRRLAVGPAFEAVQLVEDANQRIVRSSYPFAYGNYGGRLQVLRKHWGLEQVVMDADSEFDKLKALRQWVRDQWTDGWEIGELSYVPSWDARIILTLASENLCLGMCTHYATTYVQCSQALGYTSRSIFRGHALSETWSNEFKKWMVMDAGMDPNDRRRTTYHFERDGVPLNELEVHKAYYVDKKWDNIQVVATNMSEGTEEVEKPLALEPEGTIRATQQLFMPLRNNFLDHREPEEPEHGMGYFKFLGHIYWKDPTTPEVPWTDFFTTREADLYWTLNQAQMFLLPSQQDDRAVRVMLDTVTPNFAGYEYRVDGGQWTKWHAPILTGVVNPTDVRAHAIAFTGGCVELPWRLHGGKNTFEARPFNLADLRGITSRVVIDAVAK